MEFLEQFSYVIKNKKGKRNVVGDTLFIRHTFFSKLGAKILWFNHIPKIYAKDFEFSSTYVEVLKEIKGISMWMMGNFLKKEKFVFPKVYKESSYFKKHMKGD